MEAPMPMKEEERMPLAQKVLLSAIAVVTVCATSAPIVTTPAEAQQRYYRHYYPRSYYYAPRSYGYSRSAPYYGSYGGSYGGYYGGGSNGAGYSSMDSNGQRRTGSDAGAFGGGPGGG
jgi:hypothetical protein